ncbi:amino acid adenylation domain-containing protein [Amycolatopsis pretoriensis]|uniref:Amino acid adenylation domain-containing protein n=1 Tax=Amycolatopsis pretoriensis TaxID=218821 RepID=A0A1H5RDC7_9PSEU|nr:AMP-binding protein [Amycolatopsis pretoriensis]SEF36353.1 amino acid adenylation domain-containing protein [Amycolatopsis pretoriensis]
MDTGLTSGLHTRFLRGLERSGGGVAVHVGDEVLTYERLNDLALLWGGALAEAGARTVGVLAGKGVTAYAGILAGLYAGATIVPLRPDFPAARTAQMVSAAGIDVLVADERGRAVAPEGVPVLGSTAASQALTAPLAPSSDTAYVLFTSGSTGRPKGVRIGHAAVEHYFGLLDARYDFTPDDVFSQTFDLNFDCAMFDLFCAWGAGAPAVVLPGGAYRNLPRFAAERGLTVWFSTPSAIDLVRRTGGLTPGALPGLRWSFFAGEALTVRDTADWRAAASSSLIENLYGPTELTITVSGYRWDDVSTPQVAINGVVPIGEVHAGHDHVLLGDDPDEGELCIAGPQMTPGYLDPADEKGRFLERDGKRFYRTGDRVRRLPDGLAYLGRLDSQVQVLGWRIELTEVEHALRDCGIQDAVALGVAGDAGTELFVFYTGGERPVLEMVRALRAVLPEGVIPRHYRHVAEFPLNSNRKIDRKTLAARAAEILAPVA